MCAYNGVLPVLVVGVDRRGPFRIPIRTLGRLLEFFYRSQSSAICPMGSWLADDGAAIHLEHGVGLVLGNICRGGWGSYGVRTLVCDRR